MSTFINGPAHGVTLDLRRAPFMLRVTTDPEGKFDALDMLDDSPAEDETVHVYRMRGSPTVMYINGRNAKGQRIGGRREAAEYVYLEEQPPPEEVRDNTRWALWCSTNREKLLEGRVIGG